MILTFLIGCRESATYVATEKYSFEILPLNTEVVAGDAIEIRFKTSASANLFLIITNPFGNILVKPTLEEEIATFSFPKEITQKSGLCQWTLVYNQEIQEKGAISIYPNPKKGTTIESYLGPRSISAGSNDFSMFVVSPTDVYDNPLADSTEIVNSIQFENSIKKTSVQLKNLIGWKNIQSAENSGRILVTASCNKAKSKELTTIVYPANAIDFGIAYTRNHQFADGNQIISFSTNVIKDKFRNIISDGTLVTFAVTNRDGMLLQTTGTTINGVAKANLLHPTKEEDWEVTAYINGAAKSDTIKVNFESAIKNYDLSFSQDGRIVKVDAIVSFMGQWVPDGIPITMEIKDEQGILIDTKRTTSKFGKGEFTLAVDFYPNGKYQLHIRAAGILKSKNVILQ